MLNLCDTPLPGGTISSSTRPRFVGGVRRERGRWKGDGKDYGVEKDERWWNDLRGSTHYIGTVFGVVFVDVKSS
ncbi:hypothetical protein TNCV_4038431 [Trichonephila clavipes]|nr:hypothetical protein TNCV_4038431 [Trichonephila clavipes]